MKFVLAILSVVGLVNGDVDQCTPSFTSPVKASFDLKALMQAPDHRLEANDTYFSSYINPRPFRYFFNVCDKLNDPNDERLCTQNVTTDTSAFQIIDHGSEKAECMILGKTASREWALIDAENDNAAVGVKLTYRGGSSCGDNKFRSFNINFRCVETGSTLAPISTVSEQVTCAYDVTMSSIWGCPTECHSPDHRSLCSNHGVCAVDQTAKKARCFCNKGWSGELCSTSSPESEGDKSNSVTSTLIVFAILLLIALLVVAYVLQAKIRKLNSDDNPYGAFEDQIPHTAATASLN